MRARTAALETRRLRLRELTVDDADFILAQLSDPDFVRYVADRGVRDLTAARAYITSGPIASYARHGFGLRVVETKATDTPIGICGLIKRDGLDDVDLGYAFLPPFRRQGFAHEAANAVMAYARGLGFARVVAIVAPDNAPSIGLLSKLGFHYERWVTLAGDAKELLLFASAPTHSSRLGAGR